MPEHESAVDAELLQRFEKQFRLCRRCPDNISGAIAVAVSRAIEHDDPVILGSQLDQAARFEILNHAAVAMEQYQRSARATLDIVKPDVIDLNESSGRRIVALCLFRKLLIDDCRNSQCPGDDACGNIRSGLDGR